MVIANYGYQDASGAYYITIDSDRCNGCNECAQMCPQGILEIFTDDFDNIVARVKQELINRLGYICEASGCNYKCQKVCLNNAIKHSW